MCRCLADRTLFFNNIQCSMNTILQLKLLIQIRCCYILRRILKTPQQTIVWSDFDWHCNTFQTYVFSNYCNTNGHFECNFIIFFFFFKNRNHFKHSECTWIQNNDSYRYFDTYTDKFSCQRINIEKKRTVNVTMKKSK